ncbi:MAG: tRNA glutamyl-Q(34) synthetase GluQRS [Myxococcaceae bacterium]|nr:tRNA glutamyl-Q(34) synthetase GluQRS [Myxococcaceae bacterium]
MHLGNVRSALLGWLWARSSRGTFLIRMEDLDRQRCRPEFASLILRDLEWLGLDWDEVPLYQSERTALYDAELERLRAAGLLFECFCSRQEIARAASAPHGPLDEGSVYPGTCASLSDAERTHRRALRTPAIRFRPRAGTVCIDDLLQGRFCQDVRSDVGDFVIRRNDGVASYQLAVVVDDHASRITHVLRGDDLLASTPRQRLLYEALGYEPLPAYAHVPLVLGTDGKRLAKREGAFTVAELREAGVPPERVLGLLAAWSGLGEGPVSAAELVARFRLEDLPRAPIVTSEAQIRSALGV